MDKHESMALGLILYIALEQHIADIARLDKVS